jgi:hypothetical protein
MTASGFDCLGVSYIGDDLLSTILKTGAAVAEGQIEAHEQGQADAKTASEEHAHFEAAKSADAQAATAIAHAIVSGALNASTADSDRTFAEKMFTDAHTARSALAPDSEKMRDAAAKSQLARAVANAASSHGDGYKKALADAWQKVVSSNTAFDAKTSSTKSSESWLTRRVLGPVPGYGVLVGGGGILAGIGYAITRFMRR